MRRTRRVPSTNATGIASETRVPGLHTLCIGSARAVAQLFPKWADSTFRIGLFLVVAVVVGVPVFLMWWVRTPYVTGQFYQLSQPVPFDHRHHVVDDGIDCVYCHDEVERSPVAGVPSTSTCLNCHNQIWNRSPLLALVWESRSERRPITWLRVNDLPDFVFFNHAIHVNKGVGCETCHGRIDQMARVYQAAPLTMGWCLDCHRDPARYLRPRSAITTMGYRPARPQDEIGPELARRYGVRSITNCTACHR
jgi:hypothetical protein